MTSSSWCSYDGRVLEHSLLGFRSNGWTKGSDDKSRNSIIAVYDKTQLQRKLLCLFFNNILKCRLFFFRKISIRHNTCNSLYPQDTSSQIEQKITDIKKKKMVLKYIRYKFHKSEGKIGVPCLMNHSVFTLYRFIG